MTYVFVLGIAQVNCEEQRKLAYILRWRWSWWLKADKIIAISKCWTLDELFIFTYAMLIQCQKVQKIIFWSSGWFGWWKWVHFLSNGQLLLKRWGVFDKIRCRIICTLNSLRESYCCCGKNLKLYTRCRQISIFIWAFSFPLWMKERIVIGIERYCWEKEEFL